MSTLSLGDGSSGPLGASRLKEPYPVSSDGAPGVRYHGHFALPCSSPSPGSTRSIWRRPNGHLTSTPACMNSSRASCDPERVWLPPRLTQWWRHPTVWCVTPAWCRLASCWRRRVRSSPYPTCSQTVSWRLGWRGAVLGDLPVAARLPPRPRAGEWQDNRVDAHPGPDCSRWEAAALPVRPACSPQRALRYRHRGDCWPRGSGDGGGGWRRSYHGQLRFRGGHPCARLLRQGMCAGGATPSRRRLGVATKLGVFNLGSTTIAVFEPGRVILGELAMGTTLHMGSAVGRIVPSRSGVAR